MSEVSEEKRPPWRLGINHLGFFGWELIKIIPCPWFCIQTREFAFSHAQLKWAWNCEKIWKKFQTVNELDANEFSHTLVHSAFSKSGNQNWFFLLATSTFLQIETWTFVCALKMFNGIYSKIFVKKFSLLNELESIKLSSPFAEIWQTSRWLSSRRDPIIFTWIRTRNSSYRLWVQDLWTWRFAATDKNWRTNSVYAWWYSRFPGQKELVHCFCGSPEEDGLMIQCELCLCWQHDVCLAIDSEENVPDPYVCHFCRYPFRNG